MPHEIEPTWASFWEALPTLYAEPIITAVVAGAVLGFLGVYVVTRRMVFISAALSQLSGAGVALAFFISLELGELGVLTEPIVWALGLSLAAALLFRMDPARIGLSRDAVLGLMYVVAGAVAVILGSRIAQEAHDIKSILFGTAVAVRTLDLWLTVGVGTTILLLHVLLLRGMAVASFDPVGGRVQGLPVAGLDAFLFVSIAVAVAITTRALGALPVFAFTVLPAIGALALTRRLGPALALAAVSGALAGGIGYAYSFFLRFPVGAAQAAVAGVLCLSALGVRAATTRELRAPLRTAAAGAAMAVLALAAYPLFHGAGEPATHGHGHGHAHGHDHAAEPAHGAQSPEPELKHGAMAPGEDIPSLLVQLVKAEDPLKRADAAHKLGHLGHRHHDEVRPALVDALKDGEWSVRAEAAEALGTLGGDCPKELVAALRSDESHWVRAAAAGALCHYHDPEADAALRKAAESDPDPNVRAAARRHARR